MLRNLYFLLSSIPVVAVAQSQIQAVMNAASFESGLPSGGALATLFVTGVTTAPGIYVAPLGQPLPFSLGGVGVYVNYGAAPILAVIVPASGQSGMTQINFQVPMERNVSLEVNTSGQPLFPGVVGIDGTGVLGSPTIALPAQPVWGGFFAQAGGYAVALHASDRSLVTTQSPAEPGETIIAYADDFFGVWPPSPIAIPLPQGVISPFQQGDRGNGTNLYLQNAPGPAACGLPYPLQVNFEGLAQGMVGVEEVDFVVPSGQQPGNWQLYFGISSPGGTGGGCSSSTSPYVLLPVGE